MNWQMSMFRNRAMHPDNQGERAQYLQLSHFQENT